MKQIEILSNEIEGRLNDFEGGILDKEEALQSFVVFIATLLTKNQLTINKETIQLIDNMDYEALAKEYLMLVGSVDRKDIIKHDYVEGMKKASIYLQQNLGV